MPKALNIDAPQSAYSLQLVPSADGAHSLVLVGNRADTAGKLIPLSGTEKIQFSDGPFDLAKTAFAMPGFSSVAGNVIGGQSEGALRPPVVVDWGSFIEESSIEDGSGVDPASNAYTHQNAPQVQDVHGSVDNDRSEQPAVEKVNNYSRLTRVQDEPYLADEITPNVNLRKSETRSAVTSGVSSDSSSSTISAPTTSFSKGSGSGVRPDTSPPSPLPIDNVAKTLFGTNAADVLIGAQGDDVFFTSAGKDTILGLGGTDTLVGVVLEESTITQVAQGRFILNGSVIEISKGSDANPVYGSIVSGAEVKLLGVELFKQHADDTTVTLSRLALASAFNDSLAPLDAESAWLMNGLAGNDNLVGGKAGDQLSGGLGNDFIDGGSNDLSALEQFQEMLDGGDGNDKIYFRGLGVNEAGAVTTNISARLTGGTGEDEINVTLDPLVSVTVSGGAGIDTLSVELGQGAGSPFDPSNLRWEFIASGGQFLLSATAPSNALSPVLMELDPSIERIRAGFDSGAPLQLLRPDASGDTLAGSDFDDLILPVSGLASVVHAGAGNDVVVAGIGSTVSLGKGVNMLYALSNDYTLDYSDALASVRLDLAGKLGLVFDDAGEFLSIDRVLTTPDTVLGSVHADHLTGSVRSELLSGADGNDVLVTGGGSDHLQGGVGDDILKANGEGNAILAGGEGKDTFNLDFDFSGDSIVNITDFSVEDDQLIIDLSNYSAALNKDYGSYEVLSTSGDTLIATQIIGDGHDLFVLTVDLNEGLFYADDKIYSDQHFMHVDSGVHSLTAEQVSALISIDYF